MYMSAHPPNPNVDNLLVLIDSGTIAIHTGKEELGPATLGCFFHGWISSMETEAHLLSSSSGGPDSNCQFTASAIPSSILYCHC